MPTRSETITLHKLFGKKRFHALHFNESGHYHLHLKVHSGEISVHHNAYSQDSGAWLEIPQRAAHYSLNHLLSEGEERIIEFEINQQHGQFDKVFLSNNHRFQQAVIELVDLIKQPV